MSWFSSLPRSSESCIRNVQRCSSSSRSVPLSASCARGNGQAYTRDEVFLTFEECLVQVDIIDLCGVRMEGKLKAFDHTFLAIEIWIWNAEEKRMRDIRYIQAEKDYDGENLQGVITVKAFKERLSQMEGEEKRYGFDLEGCGRIQMSRLLKILEDHSSDYNLLNDNCWKYADETIRKVVKELAELPDTRAEKKDSLLKQLAKLSPLKLPADAFKVLVSKEAKALLCSLSGLVLGAILTRINPGLPILVQRLAAVQSPEVGAILTRIDPGLPILVQGLAAAQNPETLLPNVSGAALGLCSRFISIFFSAVLDGLSAKSIEALWWVPSASHIRNGALVLDGHDFGNLPGLSPTMHNTLETT